MIAQKLEGAEFVVANADAQALSSSKASRFGQAEPGEGPTFAQKAEREKRLQTPQSRRLAAPPP
jgi:cell division GTPase FtsZ